VGVAGSGHHSLGLKSNGAIVAWGENSDYQCNVPAPNENFVAVAAGEYHSLGLKSDGSIVAWGGWGPDWHNYGQSNVPALAPGDSFVAVAGGYGHSLAVKHPRKVSTFLFSYSTSGSGSGIKVQWTLSTMDQGVSFYAYRATNPSNDYAWINVDVVSPRALAYEFLDSDVEPGHTYRYKITVKDENGSRVLFETELIAAPKAPLALYQNNPNPFNPSTTISYYIPEKFLVKLEVFDVVGARVARLVSSEEASGYHSVEWKGLGDDGERVASGVYFYRLTAGKKTVSRKMVLLK
jgi:hypothetical protein